MTLGSSTDDSGDRCGLPRSEPVQADFTLTIARVSTIISVLGQIISLSSDRVIMTEETIPKLRYVMLADSLRAKILDGVYRPGERLPRQHDLAADYNVAFTTLKRALDILESEGYLVRKIGQGTYAALPTKPTLTALVVDDEESIRRFFATVLKDNQYDSVLVESGEMAVEKLKERPFDVIILDLIMPRMSGADTFREIRKIDKTVPVVIVTGYPNSDLMWEALEIGPFAVMKKPVSLHEVHAVLHNLTQPVEATASPLR